MKETKKLPPLHILSNGMAVPTEELIISIHDAVIDFRKTFGNNDTPALRDRGVLKHLCDTLVDRPHKYKNKILDDSLYIATESFFYIACQHPFHDGNKSTAYILAWLIFHTNMILNRVRLPPYAKNIHFEIHYKKKSWISAPKEAEEITRLAESGKGDAEIRRLIKRFLKNQFGIGEKDGKGS